MNDESSPACVERVDDRRRSGPSSGASCALERDDANRRDVELRPARERRDVVPRRTRSNPDRATRRRSARRPTASRSRGRRGCPRRRTGSRRPSGPGCRRRRSGTRSACAAAPHQAVAAADARGAGRVEVSARRRASERSRALRAVRADRRAAGRRPRASATSAAAASARLTASSPRRERARAHPFCVTRTKSERWPQIEPVEPLDALADPLRAPDDRPAVGADERDVGRAAARHGGADPEVAVERRRERDPPDLRGLLAEDARERAVVRGAVQGWSDVLLGRLQRGLVRDRSSAR